MTLLGIKFDVIDTYDVICWTERHDQFEHSNCSKETFLRKMYFHSCRSIRGCALFSLWISPHHGRPKTVENKGSNIRYNKINITFPDMVIVENIIPRNMIINLGCASVDNHIPRDDIFDYHHIREGNIYIIYFIIFLKFWTGQSVLTVSLSKIHISLQNLKNILFFSMKQIKLRVGGFF